MMKEVKIINQEKFKSTVKSLGTPTEVSERIGTVPSTISKWIGDRNINVRSEYLLKLMEKYNLSKEQLGVEETGNDEKNTFGTRLKELREKNKMKQNDLARKLNLASNSWCKDVNSTISKWEHGENMPRVEILKKLAYIFDVSVSYLLGLTNIIDANNEEIANILQCEENLINLIRYDNASAEVEFLDYVGTLEEFGESYFDLKNVIYGNQYLLKVLKAESDRVINYYSDKISYNRFEGAINETEILCQITEQPQRFSIEQIAHDNISKTLNALFDEYVDHKLIEIYKNDERYKETYIKLMNKEQKKNLNNDINDKIIINKIKNNIGRYLNIPDNNNDKKSSTNRIDN